MSRFTGLFLALSLPLTLTACADFRADDLRIDDPDAFVEEIESALEVADEATEVGAQVAACITDLAFCLSDGTGECRSGFRECMPRFGKKHVGKKGAKYAKASSMGADIDAAVDSVPAGAASKPGLGGGGVRGCLRDLYGCVVVDQGEPMVCADDAIACVQAAATFHKERMCTHGLERCAQPDAPADKCAKVEERCAASVQ